MVVIKVVLTLKIWLKYFGDTCYNMLVALCCTVQVITESGISAIDNITRNYGMVYYGIENSIECGISKSEIYSVVSLRYLKFW